LPQYLRRELRKATAGQCLTFLVPGTYRRIPDLEPVWHSACQHDLSKESRGKKERSTEWSLQRSFLQSCCLPLNDNTSKIYLRRSLHYLPRRL
jgi:hypothetical protein